ncbi:MAG: rod shape-determining protein MreC [Verrucomicrobia bacterium]|nr:rod shape-determining protein MreC [Verrucomicrobiota bacterium]
MLKKPHYIILSLVALLTLLVLNLPHQTAGRVKLAIGGLFLPLVGLTSSAQQLAGQGAAAITPRAELLKQNEELRRENEQAHLLALQAQEALRENERLRQLLGWQRQSPWKLKLANVILREPANWWRTVQINLGSRDGLRADLPVLTPDGLVGRIASVGLTRSQVVLLGDPNCHVSALVQETRDMGVISSGSAGPLDYSLVELAYLPNNSNLKPGQLVVTSGKGGIFPKGIPIGKIADFHPAEFGLYTEARVKLGANLSGLEEVWVLFP